MKHSIKLDNITKEYKLYKNDKDRLKDLFWGKRYNSYKALDDINITLPKGEVIGILGKNGAGKSTLLKMITGVVFPTKGTIEIEGTVSSLLELTAGFDSELTGRENIYLKGYGMGLSDSNIDKMIDDILEFAEIGEYIDQPVRMYSSGMKSRLGFAISINVNPDILVVDEVLAVGDEIFRRKCLNKMNEFKEEGKTILFVSHSINQIKAFCTKGLWLHKGKVLFYDDIKRVSNLYEYYLKGYELSDIINYPEKYESIIEIKQSLKKVLMNDESTDLEGFVSIDKDYKFEIKSILLVDEYNNSLNILPQTNSEEKNKLDYKLELKNKDIKTGIYKVFIIIDVNDKEYKRELWCTDRSSKFIDKVNKIELNIEKNRLTIKKE